MDFTNPLGEPCLFILNYLLNDVYYGELVFDLFTKVIHNRNIRVILITQHIFRQSKHSSDSSLNAKYLVLVKNVRDGSQFFRLAQLVYPKHSVDLYDLYLHTTAKFHGYLEIVLSQDINHLLRFRTEIFPDENHFPLIYAPIDYEKDTNDLSPPKPS